MSEAAKKLATNLRGKTFSGRNGEVEEVIDAAVAPLAVSSQELVRQIVRYFGTGLHDTTDLNDAVRAVNIALEQWRTGR